MPGFFAMGVMQRDPIRDVSVKEPNILVAGETKSIVRDKVGDFEKAKRAYSRAHLCSGGSVSRQSLWTIASSCHHQLIDGLIFYI